MANRRSKDEQMAHNASKLLPMYEREFNAGDKMALMEAIRTCGSHTPLPPWAAQAFAEAVRKIRNFESRDWNEVFGKPHQGKHLDSAQLRRYRFEVRFLVQSLNQTEGISDALFEDVADRISRKFGIKFGKTKCSELYYEAERELQELSRPWDEPPDPRDKT